jgi:predicted dehydrogenase
MQNAIAFKNTFKAEIAYDSYEDLVNDIEIDAIYIATPHAFHKEHTLLALKSGKAVLCEKPFAMNLEEVDAMINCATANSVLLMEALWTYFLPHYRHVLKLLEKQQFGKIKRIDADFGFYAGFDKTSRVFNKDLGGGSLLDIGIYPVFAAISTLGLPKSLEAQAKFYDNGVDSECNMVFNYDDAKAHLKCTFLEETPTECVFTCEKGIIKIHGRWHDPTSISLIDSDGNSEIKTFPVDVFGYNFEIEHINTLIRQGKTESDIMTFQKSRELISTLDKVRKKIGLDYK